jgi:hypothetical protein
MTAMFSSLVPTASGPKGAAAAEYLISHGKSGGFGRFSSSLPLNLGRGDRVVIESKRGLEIGNVLCPASERHVQFLAGTPAGHLLRRAIPADDEALRRAQLLGRQIFDDGRTLAAKSGVCLEIVDVEILLDGTAIVQFLGGAAEDHAALADALQKTFSLTVLMENLALPAPEAEDHHHGGCGKPDCGKAGGGGCTSCGSDGGCSSCGSGKVDVKAYFSHLRSKMDDRFRTPLL